MLVFGAYSLYGFANVCRNPVIRGWSKSVRIFVTYWLSALPWLAARRTRSWVGKRCTRQEHHSKHHELGRSHDPAGMAFVESLLIASKCVVFFPFVPAGTTCNLETAPTVEGLLSRCIVWWRVLDRWKALRACQRRVPVRVGPAIPNDTMWTQSREV